MLYRLRHHHYCPYFRKLVDLCGWGVLYSLRKPNKKINIDLSFLRVALMIKICPNAAKLYLGLQQEKTIFYIVSSEKSTTLQNKLAKVAEHLTLN